MLTFAYRLLEKRGIFFYFLFIGYLLFLHPHLLKRLAATSSTPDPVIGWTFLLLPFFELIGFWFKYPVLSFYARTYPQKASTIKILAMVFLPILHLGMAAFLFIIGTQITGLQPEGDAAWYWQLLYVAGFFLILFKELGFLALFFSFGGIPWTNRQEKPPQVFFLKRLSKSVNGHDLRPLLEDALGDIFLFVFATLGYTALWEYTGMVSTFYTHVGFWRYFMQLLGVLLYFLMVIPPLQAVYLMQYTLIRHTKRQQIWAGFQFVFTLVAAFWVIIRS